MIHLIVTLKGRTVGRFDVESDRVRIGRHPENEVQIDNMSVSRFHCLLERGSNGWEAEDQGSHNGTFLNGAKTSGRARLNDGDTLGIGQFHVAVRTDERPAPRAAQPMIAVRSGTSSLEREKLATEKGFLLRQTSAGGPLPLTRDLFQFGSLASCEVPIPGPRKRALIVRGQGGFQIVNVDNPAGVSVNGQPVPDQAWLNEGDQIQVGDQAFTFKLGLPPTDNEATMELNLKDIPLRPPPNLNM